MFCLQGNGLDDVNAKATSAKTYQRHFASNDFFRVVFEVLAVIVFIVLPFGIVFYSENQELVSLCVKHYGHCMNIVTPEAITCVEKTMGFSGEPNTNDLLCTSDMRQVYRSILQIMFVLYCLLLTCVIVKTITIIAVMASPTVKR